MEGMLKASFAFIEASIAAGTNGARLSKLVCDQLQSLKTNIGRMSNDLNDATCALALIADTCPFDAEQRAELVDVIQTTLSMGAHACNADSKNQEHLHTYNYYTESIWNVILNTPDVEEVFKTLINLFHKIGLRYPSEPSKKVVVATIMAARRKAVSHHGAWCMLKQFTRLNNTMRKTRKDQALTMHAFPYAVADFQRLYPHAYDEDAPPVDCRLDPQLIKDAVPFVVARSTNSLLRQEGHGTGSYGSVTGDAMLPSRPQTFEHMMQGCMRQMMMGVMSMHPGFNASNASGSGDVPMTFNTPSKKLKALANEPPACGTGQFVPPGSHGGASSAQPPICDHVDDGRGDSHEQLADAADDIDKMLDVAMSGGKAAATHGGDDKAKPHCKSKAKPSAMKVMKVVGAHPEAMKGAPAMKAAKVAPPKAKKDDSTIVYDKPPKFGSALPCVFNGCKIYESVSGKKYRVVPKPGVSPYDRQFSYASDGKQKAWSAVVKYCTHPFIPKTSCNFAK